MDSCIISTNTAPETRAAGASLLATLYRTPVTILLTGELGAGKTTFLQGFGHALAIPEWLSSPTYALEQRYATPLGELLHLDLYRLNERDARQLVMSTDDHQGIRCIEWAERLSPDAPQDVPHLHLHFAEENQTTRRITCTFRDVALPTRETILQWRRDVMLPPHVAAHCDAVAAMAKELGKSLMEAKKLLRPLALECAAAVHDLFRFVDFRPEGAPPDVVEGDVEKKTWEQWRTRYPNLRHEAVCQRFLQEQGFEVLGDIVEPHGLQLGTLPRSHTEQKLLYYADKRVMGNTPVTLQTRFDDFAQRYGKGNITAQQKQWLQEVKKVESELFPDGITDN